MRRAGQQQRRCLSQIGHDPTRRLRVEIHGAVQGVGFRPFVYRLATDLLLNGWVLNDARGVFIEVEGPAKILDTFLDRLPAEKPPRALIHSLEPAWLDPIGFTQFEIRHSNEQGTKSVLVLPDIATCADCLAEVMAPDNRRWQYPFTNCTNCGPRFTIIQALPYDRPHTTMGQFTMCAACQAEYDNPRDRRFHAQPDACAVCGPHVMLWGRKSTETDIPLEATWTIIAERTEALQQTANALGDGQIVAVKGLGGFHLMVDARNQTAIALLRERKPRRDKPFALMVRDLEQARVLCKLTATDEALLLSPEAPIVLLPHRDDAPVAANVAPDTRTLGVMLPATPLHHLLLRLLGFPLVATSGNLSDEPICTTGDEAMQRLGHIADLFLDHNRPIARHVDDSVTWVLADMPRVLRRARGYAPMPVLAAQALPTILAVGGHLKNTVALSVERQVFISQHIGDLETPEAMTAFETVIADFLRLYEAQPVAIAHDLHPDYLSTRWAREASMNGARLVAVQHHHAHLAACLADHGKSEPALGITWDGSGYGPDGTIWGGEFLLGDAVGFTRVAHLRPFRLPGGEAAIKQPRRVALALLWQIFGDAVLEWDDLAVIRAFQPAERRVLARMLHQGLNAPLTTSVGRLFDGVAALLGLYQQVSFEGQAAIALEFAADPDLDTAYPLVVTEQPIYNEQRSGLVLDWQPLVEALLQDLRHGARTGMIAARFHNTLVHSALKVARLVGEPRVALTGGCFQNRRLTTHMAQCLAADGFEVLLHRQVPPNDGGISLGQAMIAAAQLKAN